MKKLLTILLYLVCPMAFGAASATGPVVYVSPIGKINSTTVVQNNGAQFGPDTTGTKTSGVQEAINSLPQTNGVGEFVGGGRVHLLNGFFNCTTQIFIPNQFPFVLALEGSGEGTYLINRTPVATNFIVCADPSKNYTLNGSIKDMTILRGRGFDTNCDVLIALTANEFVMENVILAPEQAIHSNQYGAPFVWYVGVPTNKVGTVGLRMDACINRNLIRFCRFFGLSNGALLAGDHTAVEYCLFGNISKYYINGGGAESTGNTWVAVNAPASAAKAITNIFSAGVGLIIYHNNFEANVIQPQFFASANCVANVANFLGNYVKVVEPLIESCDVRTLTGINESGDDLGNTTHVYYNFRLSGGTPPADKFIDITSGAVTTTSPNGESALTEFVFGANNDLTALNPVFSVRQSIGGPITNLFSFSNIGEITDSGHKLTNHADVVSTVPPAAGDVLAYNSVTSKWTNGPPSGGAAATGVTNGWKATLTLGGTINITNLSSGLNMVNDQGQSGVVGPINTVTPAYALAPDSGITMWGTNAVTTNGLSAIQQVPAAYFGLGNGSAIRTFLDITNTYPFARFGGNTNAFSVSTTAGAYVFGVHTNGSTFDGVGIIIKSNTLASIPPLLPGDVYLYSSNGIAFRILVGPTGTRTTNTW